MCPGIGATEPLYVETVKALASLDKYHYLEPDSTKIGGLVKDMLTFICEGKYALLYVWLMTLK